MKKKEKEEKKTDPRIERTQQMLWAALMRLIEEKGFDAISVGDITKQAGLNRATFYLHYRDKQDLLIQGSETVLNRLVALGGPVDPGNLKLDEPPRQLVVLFSHVAEHADFYRVVLGKTGVPAFVDRLRDYAAQVGRERIVQIRLIYPDAKPILDDEFVSQFMAGALLGLITWWLENNMPHSPEYMADRFGWLSIAGAYPMLGFPTPEL